MASASVPVLANLEGLLPELEAIYKDIHSHPELSMQEERTAGVVADHLRAVGYEVIYRGWRDRRCWFVPQRRGANSDAPRRHGCAAGSGSHRPSLCQ